MYDILLTEVLVMKKFFGIVLILSGSSWSIICLSIVRLGDAIEVFASLIVLAIGVVPAILGIMLLKGKKNDKQNSESNDTVKRYTRQRAQSSSTSQQPQDSRALKLKEIRILAVQKFNSIDESEGRVSSDELTQTFYSLNDSRLPFEFEESTQADVDIIGHWKLADNDYLGFLGFSKHEIQEQFDVLIKFDELYGIIRCKDKYYRKESSVGFSGMGMEMSTFSGKSTSVKKEIVFGRKKDGTIGKVANISLDTSILHNAIKVVADKCNWEVKKVVGKL